MTTRDELADLLLLSIGGTYTAKATVPVVVDAILARWRLVPVGSVWAEPDASTVDCPGCGRYVGQPCYRIEHLSDDGYTRRDIPVDLPIGSYHLVRQNAANQHAAQHRAAGELTQHDQEAGYYGDICQRGEGAEHTPRIHP